MYKTEQKKAIEEYLCARSNQSISTITLLDVFKSKMNRATIYRQLAALEQKKVLRKSFNVEKNVYEYQYARDCDNHLHLVCKRCGKAIHLACQVANEFMVHILEEHGFSIDKYQSMITGVCKECEAEDD